MRFLKWKGAPLQVSGISTEIFKQIETVENDHDASTAAALEAVERRGEMVVRVIEPRQMGRQASEAAKKFIAMQVRLSMGHLFPTDYDSFALENVLSCHKSALICAILSLRPTY